MNLARLVQDETLQIILTLFELAGVAAVSIKLVTGFLWPRFRRGNAAAQKHFEAVIALSVKNDSYAAACTLILLTRVMTALFFVIVSLAFLFISLWARGPKSGGASGWLNGDGLTGTVANDVTLVFVLLSCTLFVGNVVSATNFSRATRRRIDPGSVKAPFARGFFGFEA